MTIKEEAIKIYFHMKNHYRRLRQVKSTINSYNSKGYAHGIQRRRPPSRCQYRRDIPSTSRPKRIEKSNQTCEEIGPKEIKIKRHDCIGIKWEENNPPVRPCTRRPTNSKPLESPHTRKNPIPCELLRFLENKLNTKNIRTDSEQKCFKQENRKLIPQLVVPVPVPVPVIKLSEKRPLSSGSSNLAHCSEASAKRGENLCTGNKLLIIPKKPLIQANPTPKTPTTSSVSSISTSASSQNTQNIRITLPKVSDMPNNPQDSLVDVSLPEGISSRLEDHDYLRFALAITEDIIRNDLYTSKDMKRVCQSHFEANKNHLDNDRMKKQINLLSKQLGFSLDEEDISDSRDVLKKHRQTIKSDLTCDCGSIHREVDKNYKQCTCQSKTCLPFQCSYYEEEISSKNLDQKVSRQSSKSSQSITKSSPAFKESPEKDSLQSNPSGTQSARKMREPSNELYEPFCCESLNTTSGNNEDEKPQIMIISSHGSCKSCNFGSSADEEHLPQCNSRSNKERKNLFRKRSSNKSPIKYCSTCEASAPNVTATEPASENNCVNENVEGFAPTIRVLESVSEHTEPSNSVASVTKGRNCKNLGKNYGIHVELEGNSDNNKSSQMKDKCDCFSKEASDGNSDKHSVSKKKVGIVEDFCPQIAINTINTSPLTSRKKLLDSCNISPDFCSPVIMEVPQKKLLESCNILPDFCSPLITDVPQTQKKLFDSCKILPDFCPTVGITDENKILIPKDKHEEKCTISPELSGYPRSPCKTDKKEDKRLLDEDYDLIPERDNFKIPDITVQTTGDLNFNNLLLDDSYELPKKFPITGAPYPLWFYETVATQTGSFTSLQLPTEIQKEIPQKSSTSTESRIESQTSSKKQSETPLKKQSQTSSKKQSETPLKKQSETPLKKQSQTYPKKQSPQTSYNSREKSASLSPIDSESELALSTSSSSSTSEYGSEVIMNKPSSSFHILSVSVEEEGQSSLKKVSQEQVSSTLPPNEELEPEHVFSSQMAELHPFQQVYEQTLLNKNSPVSLIGTYRSGSEYEVGNNPLGLRDVYNARHSSKTLVKNIFDNISEERNSDSYLIHDDLVDPNKHKYAIHHSDPVLSETDSLEEGIEPYIKELNKRPLVSVTKSIEDRIQSVTDELEKFRQVTEVRTVSPTEVLQETIKKNAIAEVIPKTIQVEERDVQYEFIPPTVQETETDTGFLKWRKKKAKVSRVKSKPSSIILKKEPQLLLDDKTPGDSGELRRSLRFSQMLIHNPESKDHFHDRESVLMNKNNSNHEMKPISVTERTEQNNSKTSVNQETNLPIKKLDHGKNDKPKKRVHL